MSDEHILKDTRCLILQNEGGRKCTVKIVEQKMLKVHLIAKTVEPH